MAKLARRFAWVAPIVGFLLPFAIWAVLASTWGRERLRAELVSAVNDSVQGTLVVGDLRIGPGLAVTIYDVSLVTPEGDRALEASKAHATVSIPSLARGRVDVQIVAERPFVSLTPDEAGQPAIMRALAPEEEQEDAEKGGMQLALQVYVKDGRVIREATKALDLGEIDFLLRMDADGERTKMTIEGHAQLEKPARLPLSLRAEIERGDTDVIVRKATAVAGKSRVSIAEAEWTGDASTSGGSVFALLHPDDVRALVPQLSPAAPIELHANAVPIDGVLHASAVASLEGGGTLSVAARRWPDGSAAGSAAIDGIEPAKWGWLASPAQRVFAHGSLARAKDGRIAAHLEGAPVDLREARIDDVDVELVRATDGTLEITLARLAAHDETGRWKLQREATITKRGSVIDIERVAISGPWGQRILAEGRWPPEPKKPLRIDVVNLAMHGLPGRLVPTLEPLAGFVHGRVKLESRPDGGAPEGSARIAWKDASWGDKGPVHMIASATLDDGRARVFLDATTWRGEKLKLVADAPLRVPRKSDHLFVEAVAKGLDAGDLEDVSAVVTAGIDHGRTWLSIRAVDDDRVLFRVAGTTEADWSSFRGRTPASIIERLPDAALTIADLDLASIAAAGFLPAGTEGTVGGIGAIVGGELSAHLTSTGTRAGPMQDIELAVGLRHRRGGAIVSVLARDASGGAAAAGVHATYDLRSLFAGKTDSLRWTARAAVADLGIGEATGATAAPRVLQPDPAITGRLDAALAIDGRSIHPRGWLWARAPDVRVKENRFGRVLVASRLADDGAAAWLSTEPLTGGKLAAVARLTGDPKKWLANPASAKTSPLFAAVAADDLALAPYGDFIERVRKLGGTADARGVVRGTIAKPQPMARLVIVDGTVETMEIGRVRGIEIVATADSSKIHLSKLVARGGRGGVLTGAALATKGREKWHLSGGLVSRNFSVRGDRFAGEIDGRANLAGDVVYPNLTATVHVDSAVVFLPQTSDPDLQPLGPHPDIVVLEPGGEIRRVAGRDEKPPVKPEAIIATLRVIFPRDVWVRGKDVNIELKGDVTVKTGAKEPELAGEIEALRGKADVMGKDFVIERARIGFIGGPARKARLDVLATHTMEDVEKTEVHAQVAGTIEEPKITLTSDPPMPEDAVASMLVLGTADPRSRPGGEESPSLAGRAATFVGNYLTKELRDEVQEIIPVDVFELEPGSAGSASEGRLRVGKYIAPGLFLSYAHAFGAAPDEGANALRLEYRFHNAWYLISEFTDGSRGDVDLVWTREY